MQTPGGITWLEGQEKAVRRTGYRSQSREKMIPVRSGDSQANANANSGPKKLSRLVKVSRRVDRQAFELIDDRDTDLHAVFQRP